MNVSQKVQLRYRLGTVRLANAEDTEKYPYFPIQEGRTFKVELINQEGKTAGHLFLDPADMEMPGLAA